MKNIKSLSPRRKNKVEIPPAIKKKAETASECFTFLLEQANLSHFCWPEKKHFYLKEYNAT